MKISKLEKEEKLLKEKAKRIKEKINKEKKAKHTKKQVKQQFSLFKGIVNLFNFLINTLKKYPEILSIPTGIMIWEIVRNLLKTNPENAPIDNAVVQIIPFTFIQFSIYLSLSWLFLGIIFGTFKKYLISEMKNDFKSLEKWQKIVISYTVFFLLLLSMVVLSTALL